MTHHHRLVLRLARIGLVSGIGTGVALLLYARTGFGALLGDVGFYLLLAGAGWFTGQAVGTALTLAAPRRQQVLSAVFALAYAAGVAPLNALLLEVSLTGAWKLPALWLATICAALSASLAWSVGEVGGRVLAVAAAIGVAAMAAIVAAVNVLIWVSAGWKPPFDSLVFAGLWLIYLVPAIWLPTVTYFCLKPLPQGPQTGL